jgi:iron complex outermembrane recepter protein
MKKSACYRGAALIALLSSIQAPAFAQGSDTAVIQDDNMLGDIIVTATRRSASQQNVGVAITAFDQEDLRERGIDNIAALADATPGLKLVEATGGGVPVIVIRGVGLQDFRINNTPTAAIYVDEVYQTSVAQAGFTFFDLERLELLKGPQGGLYGRNTTGGAIQVISNRPSLTETSGYVELGYARFGTFTAEAAVGTPLVEDVAGLRIAGRIARGSSGYSRGLPASQNWGEENRFGLRAMLRVKPASTVDLLLKVHGGRDRSETPLLRTVPIWAAGVSAVPGIGSGAFSNFVLGRADRAAICPDILAGNRPNPATCATLTGSQGVPDGASVYDTLSNPLNRLDNSWFGVSFDAQAEFGDSSLRSITAYDEFEVGRFTDWDATPLTFQHIDYRSKIKAFSQELRFAYIGPSVNFQMGVNYARDTLEENSTLFADTGVVPLAFRTTSVFQPYRQRTETVAAYTRLDVRLAEQLTIVGEARYTYEQKDFAGGTFLVDPNRFLVQVDRRAAFGDYSGKLALEYRPADDLLFYGSISRGYKSGGFFGGIATNAAQLDPYQPETVIAYEAGIKSEFLNQRLRVNTSIFQYDYSDLQGFGRETTGAVQIQRLTNLGDARIRGAELEIVAVPVRGLTISANATLLDGNITDSRKTSSDSFGLNTRNSFAGLNLTNYSRWNLGGVIRYEAPLGSGLKAAFQADATYRSSQDFSYIFIPEERVLFREPGYALAGMRVSIGNEESGWEIAGWVKNLSGKEYRSTARTDSFGGVFEVYGPPATYGVSARINF